MQKCERPRVRIAVRPNLFAVSPCGRTGSKLSAFLFGIADRLKRSRRESVSNQVRVLTLETGTPSAAFPKYEEALKNTIVQILGFLLELRFVVERASLTRTAICFSKPLSDASGFCL